MRDAVKSRLDDGYQGVTQGIRNQQPFCFIVTAGQLLSFFLFCSFKNVHCLTVTSLQQSSVFQKHTAKTVKRVKLEEHISVSRMEHVSRERGKVLKKKKKKKVGMTGEAGIRFFFECREFSICRFSEGLQWSVLLHWTKLWDRQGRAVGVETMEGNRVNCERF